MLEAGANPNVVNKKGLAPGEEFEPVFVTDTDVIAEIQQLLQTRRDELAKMFQ